MISKLEGNTAARSLARTNTRTYTYHSYRKREHSNAVRLLVIERSSVQNSASSYNILCEVWIVYLVAFRK